MSTVYRIDGTGDVVLDGGSASTTGTSTIWANGPTYPADPPTPWDLLPEEEKQPVHPWTLAWWRLLPACHRYLDPLQGQAVGAAWHGLNADPRWILSWDGWETYNRSTTPTRAVVEFRRIFRSVPERPTYVQVWGDPQGHTVDVSIRLADSSGNVFGGTEEQLTGTERGMVGALVDRPRNGILVVSVIVALDTWSERLALDAIHVGDQFVDAFDQLPDYADKKTPGPYPLLRWMDGPGRVAGEISDIVANLNDGVYTDPRRCPEEALRWLAMMSGFPVAQIPADSSLLREHLIHFTDHGRPLVGSRESIEEVASRWLTGTRTARVVPQRLYGSESTPEEAALLTAAGRTGAVHLTPAAPVPDVEYQWSGDAHGSVSVKYARGVREAENRILNPSFELGVAKWTPRLGSALDHDTTRFKTGTASARLTLNGHNHYILEDHKTPLSETETRLAFMVYTEREARVRPYVWMYDGPTDQGGPTHVVPAHTWTVVEMTFAPVLGARYRPSLISLEADPLVVWVDSVYEARSNQDAGDYFDGDRADSTFADVWVDSDSPDPAAPAVYVWQKVGTEANDRWFQLSDPYVVQAGADALAAAEAIPREKAHTLVLLARPDEVPGGDLDAFASFVKSQDVVPAGHRLIARNPVVSWDVHEAAVGETWEEVQRFKTWNDQESAGLLEN